MAIRFSAETLGLPLSDEDFASLGGRAAFLFTLLSDAGFLSGLALFCCLSLTFFDCCGGCGCVGWGVWMLIWRWSSYFGWESVDWARIGYWGGAAVGLVVRTKRDGSNKSWLLYSGVSCRLAIISFVLAPPLGVGIASSNKAGFSSNWLIICFHFFFSAFFESRVSPWSTDIIFLRLC